MRTNNELNIKEEPNPTKKQLDDYMRKGSKYKKYLKDMYKYGDYGKMPTNMKYSDGGKLSYELDGDAKNWMGSTLYPTAESVKTDIMDNSLEDGMYGAPPPSHGVYPTKKKYEYSFNGKIYKQYEELGVIDCRNRATITVKKFEPKKKSLKASIKRK